MKKNKKNICFFNFLLGNKKANHFRNGLWFIFVIMLLFGIAFYIGPREEQITGGVVGTSEISGGMGKVTGMDTAKTKTQWDELSEGEKVWRTIISGTVEKARKAYEKEKPEEEIKDKDKIQSKADELKNLPLDEIIQKYSEYKGILPTDFDEKRGLKWTEIVSGSGLYRLGDGEKVYYDKEGTIKKDGDVSGAQYVGDLTTLDKGKKEKKTDHEKYGDWYLNVDKGRIDSKGNFYKKDEYDKPVGTNYYYSTKTYVPTGARNIRLNVDTGNDKVYSKENPDLKNPIGTNWDPDSKTYQISGPAEGDYFVEDSTGNIYDTRNIDTTLKKQRHLIGYDFRKYPDGYISYRSEDNKEFYYGQAGDLGTYQGGHQDGFGYVYFHDDKGTKDTKDDIYYMIDKDNNFVDAAGNKYKSIEYYKNVIQKEEDGTYINSQVTYTDKYGNTVKCIGRECIIYDKDNKEIGKTRRGGVSGWDSFSAKWGSTLDSWAYYTSGYSGFSMLFGGGDYYGFLDETMMNLLGGIDGWTSEICKAEVLDSLGDEGASFSPTGTGAYAHIEGERIKITNYSAETPYSYYYYKVSFAVDISGCDSAKISTYIYDSSGNAYALVKGDESNTAYIWQLDEDNYTVSYTGSNMIVKQTDNYMDKVCIKFDDIDLVCLIGIEDGDYLCNNIVEGEEQGFDFECDYCDTFGGIFGLDEEGSSDVTTGGGGSSGSTGQGSPSVGDW